MSRGRNMGDQGLLSIARHGRDLSLNPAVDAGVEDVEREGAAGEDLVVKSFQVEPGPQLLFGAFAQLADLELAELVAACLAGPEMYRSVSAWMVGSSTAWELRMYSTT